MQNATTKTYQDNYQQYKDKSPHEVFPGLAKFLDSFLELLPPGAKVLEIGSAHGRDARYFRERGFDVTCSDIMKDALVELENDGFKTFYFDLLEQVPEDLGNYDGIFADAVLHHFSPEDTKTILGKLYSAVKKDAIFVFDMKAGEGEVVEKEVMNGERYFKLWTKKEVSTFIENTSWKLISAELSTDGKWIEVRCKK